MKYEETKEVRSTKKTKSSNLQTSEFRLHKGFGLIELIIVIAVIGVLAGIILAALGPARNQAKDARIISDLHQLQNRAEIIYLDKGVYYWVEGTTPRGVCWQEGSCDSEILTLRRDINSQGGQTAIISSADKYCAYSKLISSNQYFCVDSFGFADIQDYAGMCSTRGYCAFSSCPDVNNNKVVDCGFYDYPTSKTQPITTKSDCPDPPHPESDVRCVLQCVTCPPCTDCGGTSTDLCIDCPDLNGNSVKDPEECLAIYDMDKSGAVNMWDVIFTSNRVGDICD
jgi:prepilin-type N-terminal cleavage/methylation domain-containing protein